MGSGGFSDESLEAYQQLLSSEGQVYDFARCIRPDGSFYGTKGKCKAPNRLAPDKKEGTEGKEGVGAKVEKPPIGSGISNDSYRVLSGIAKGRIDKVTSDLESRRNLQFEFLKDNI